MVVGGPDAGAESGIAYDSFTKSIVWSVGNIIKRRSIVDGATDVVIDLSSRSDLTGIIDIATDQTNGNIFFAAGGILGKIEHDEYTSEIYKGVDEMFVAIDLDYLLPKVFGIINSTVNNSYVVMKFATDVSLSKRSVDDSPTQVIFTGSGDVYCLSLDIFEQVVYWSDGIAIYRSDYDGTEVTTFFTDTMASSIRDLDIVGDNVYFVGKDNPAVIRVNKHDNTSVTTTGPESGLLDMNWLDVNKSPGTETTPTMCSNVVKTMNCTGSWFHHYAECPIEGVSGDLVVTIAKLISGSCEYVSGQKTDYNGEDLVYGFTNSKIWIYNGCEATFHICADNMCNIDDLSHATLPATCLLNTGEECDNFVCDFGYERNPSATTLTCTEDSVWNHDLSTVCIESAPITCTTLLKTITCTGSWYHHYAECPIEDISGDIVVTIGELLSSSCDYFSGKKLDYDGDDLVYGFSNNKIWIYNGCEATFHVCAASATKTCPSPDSKMLSFLCDSVCPSGSCSGDEICCPSDTCGSDVCVLGLEDQGADADGCPYAPALYAEDACAADPDGACASSDDCDPGLVCCYSFECGDNWCVTQQQSEATCPQTIDNGHLSNNCSTNINASCDDIICDVGHVRNSDVTALVCNDAGTWDYEVSFVCDSMESAINCRVTPPNGPLLPDWIDQLGSTCNYTICNDNFRSVQNNYSVVCMASNNFEVYDAVKCSASECSGGHSVKFSSVQLLCLLLLYFPLTAIIQRTDS